MFCIGWHHDVNNTYTVWSITSWNLFSHVCKIRKCVMAILHEKQELLSDNMLVASSIFHSFPTKISFVTKTHPNNWATFNFLSSASTMNKSVFLSNGKELRKDLIKKKMCCFWLSIPTDAFKYYGKWFWSVTLSLSITYWKWDSKWTTYPPFFYVWVFYAFFIKTMAVKFLILSMHFCIFVFRWHSKDQLLTDN